MNVQLGKAIAGGAGAARDVALEAMRAEIMQQRDARLNEYSRRMQTDVVQPFQTSERQATEQFQAGQTEKGQTFTAGENQKNRDLQAKSIDAVVKQADVAYQKGMIEVDSLKQLKQLQQAYMNAKTPEEAGQIADQLYTLQGKDKYTPLVGKDEMGNPVFMGAFSTRSGKLETGKNASDANDPLGLRGGKKDYSGMWKGGGTSPPSAGQQTQDESNFAAGFNKVRGILPSDNDSNAYIEALTGQPNAAGTIELHTAQNILANMKASNNFTVKSPYGGSVNKAAVIADLQKALPYAKGPELAEIQQAIATLSSAEQQAQKDFTTGYNSVSGTPPGRK